MDKEIRQELHASWQTMLDTAQKALKDESEDWTPNARTALEHIVSICQERLKEKPE